jgi:hypothetical protein
VRTYEHRKGKNLQKRLAHQRLCNKIMQGKESPGDSSADKEQINSRMKDPAKAESFILEGGF